MRQPFVCEYTYRVFAFSVCHQVQNELSQKTENLHREVAQKQQLSEEFEQVSLVHFFSLFFSFLVLSQQGVIINSQWIKHLCVHVLSTSRLRGL